MRYSEIVTIDSDILNGTPVFKNTRVPVQSLFWHLEKNITLNEFLEDFPTVEREQALQLLQLLGKLLSASHFKDLYETAIG